MASTQTSVQRDPTLLQSLGGLLAIFLVTACAACTGFSGAAEEDDPEARQTMVRPSVPESSAMSPSAAASPNVPGSGPSVTDAPPDLLLREDPLPADVKELLNYGEGGDAPCVEEVESPVLDTAVRLLDFRDATVGQLGWPVVFCLGDVPGATLEVVYPDGTKEGIGAVESGVGYHALLPLDLGSPVGDYMLTVVSDGTVLASQSFPVIHAREPRILNMDDPAARGGPTHLGLVGFEPSANVRVAVYRTPPSDAGFEYGYRTETVLRANQDGEAILRVTSKGVSGCTLFVASPESLEAFVYEEGVNGQTRYGVDFGNPLVQQTCWRPSDDTMTATSGVDVVCPIPEAVEGSWVAVDKTTPQYRVIVCEAPDGSAWYHGNRLDDPSQSISVPATMSEPDTYVAVNSGYRYVVQPSRLMVEMDGDVVLDQPFVAPGG